MSMQHPVRSLVVVVALLSAAGVHAAAPTPESTIARMLTAEGGADTFHKLGVLKLVVSEDESTASGRTRQSNFTAYVSTIELDHLRIELPREVVIARNGGEGWATMSGKPDTRPQTPAMAVGTCNQRLFPLLLPFSVTMAGSSPSGVSEATFQGQPAWRIDLVFERDFFSSPVMNVTWQIYASKKDGAFLGAEFQPPLEYAAKVGAEGVRYRVLATQKVDGVTLPSQILMEGIDAKGHPSGHNRTVKIAASIRGPWDAALFMDPRKVEAIEEGNDILDPGGR
jgi:hypothetical protein